MRQARLSEKTAICTSIHDPQSIERFLMTVKERLGSEDEFAHYEIPASDGKAIAWLYRHAQVLKTIEQNNNIEFQLKIRTADKGKFEKEYGYKSF